MMTWPFYLSGLVAGDCDDGALLVAAGNFCAQPACLSGFVTGVFDDMASYLSWYIAGVYDDLALLSVRACSWGL